MRPMVRPPSVAFNSYCGGGGSSGGDASGCHLEDVGWYGTPLKYAPRDTKETCPVGNGWDMSREVC